DAIPNETHELADRHDDPLRGPLNEVIDAGIEKGQNNRGWSLVRIAPSRESLEEPAQKTLRRIAQKSTSREADVQLSLLASNRWGQYESFQKTGSMPRLKARPHETLSASIGLHAGRLQRGHGILQVFDGDPALGATMIMSRAVQGLAGDAITREEIEWRPQHAGDRVLYVRYFGNGGSVTPALQVPVSVRP
ncbi:MAG: hypothetical protein K0Q64_1877, partial [Nitrobacter vulgaris]|nr:hypothetical protein [Nitrobacter vulgaris]